MQNPDAKTMATFVEETLKSSSSRNYMSIIMEHGPIGTFFHPLLVYLGIVFHELLDERIPKPQPEAKKAGEQDWSLCGVAIWMESRCFDPVMTYLGQALNHVITGNSQLSNSEDTAKAALGMAPKDALAALKVLADKVDAWEVPELPEKRESSELTLHRIKKRKLQQLRSLQSGVEQLIGKAACC